MLNHPLVSNFVKIRFLIGIFTKKLSADDFHLAAALGSGQRIYFPNLLDALPPLW
jgi:hypothetical protein